MERRETLLGLAVVFGSAAAGCLGSPPATEPDGSDEPPEPTGSGTATGSSPTNSETTEPGTAGTPTDVSFEVGFVSSGQETQDATVSLGSTTRIDGKITGETGCHTAELADVSVADGTLSVTVRSEKSEDAADVCSQQLVVIRYRAAFEFRGDGPSEVVVYHDSLGERREVARVGA